MMPLCGTFHYAGMVPYGKACDKSRPWKLQDESGAAPLQKGNSLVDNRLIGLQPVLEISDSYLLLTASGRHRANIRSAILFWRSFGPRPPTLAFLLYAPAI